MCIYIYTCETIGDVPSIVPVGSEAATGRGRIRRCFSVGEASTVRYFGVIIGSIG